MSMFMNGGEDNPDPEMWENSLPTYDELRVAKVRLETENERLKKELDEARVDITNFARLLVQAANETFEEASRNKETVNGESRWEQRMREMKEKNAQRLAQEK